MAERSRQPTRHLWVGGLPEETHKDDLYAIFGRFGDVDFVKLLPSRPSEVGLAAFVDFASVESAVRAVAAAPSLRGNSLRLDFNCPRRGISHSDQGDVKRTSRLYVSDVPMMISSKQLAEVFDRYGRVEKCDIVNKGTYCFAFVHLSTPREATTAQKNIDGMTFHGRSLRVRFQTPKEKFRSETSVEPPAKRTRTCSSPLSERNAVSTPTASDTPMAPEDESDNFLPEGMIDGISMEVLEVHTGAAPTHSGLVVSSPQMLTEERAATHDRQREHERGHRVRERSRPREEPERQRPGTANGMPTEEDTTSTSLYIRNFETHHSDAYIEENLKQLCRKFGAVEGVHIMGAHEHRYIFVNFRTRGDAEQARAELNESEFMGQRLMVKFQQRNRVAGGLAPCHQGSVREYEPSPRRMCSPPPRGPPSPLPLAAHRLDDCHFGDTRTLFIGSLEHDITRKDLRQLFERYGDVLSVDIKMQAGQPHNYGFVRYGSVREAVNAKRQADYRIMGRTPIKVGFGKRVDTKDFLHMIYPTYIHTRTRCLPFVQSTPTPTVWILGFRGLAPERDVRAEFRRFGHVELVENLRDRGVVVTFSSIDEAGRCIDKLGGRSLGPPLRAVNLKLEFTDPPYPEFPERVALASRPPGSNLDRPRMESQDPSLPPPRRMRSPSLERRRSRDMPPPHSLPGRREDRDMYREGFGRPEPDRYHMEPRSVDHRDRDAPRDIRDFREHGSPRDFQRRPRGPPANEFGRDGERGPPPGPLSREEFLSQAPGMDIRERLRPDGPHLTDTTVRSLPPTPYAQPGMDYPPAPTPAPAPASGLAFPAALHSGTGIVDFHRYPISWRGQLGLKSTTVAVRMHLMSGHQELLAVLPPPPGPIKIAQRLRLAQLEPLSRCLQAGPEFYCMLLIRPGFSDEDAASYSGALTTHFVHYLLDKQAAGIVQAPSGTLYILPPCEFALQYLSVAAPSLDPQQALMDHLLLVITRPGT